ncbi:carbon-nitrogen hydrolase family protein [Massilia sp. CF038]|uniref:carbon-nitrogen hydrolase family protein n=1 Tax=Massilia sp. CF038 TaxID=1881045 RepID=UPI00091CFA0C|nr:carbon-nitrogen hydrolase family protein [Massilia sp. CF038]SHH22578.1 apolipoprotein N-acyltransferase [Massilia sp. CF038]
MIRTVPLPLPSPRWQRFLLAAVMGIALRAVVGLESVWWLAWVVPAPLLALACRSSASDARWTVAFAALIGTSVNLPYFAKVMPLQFALLVIVLQALTWLVVVMAARRVVLRYGAWWTVFAYPLIWAALDTLTAAFLPDGNWGSLGYTQADFLPALQLTALFGVPGLVFVMSLTASALAMPLTFGRTLPQAWRASALSALVLLGTLSYGAARLATPATPGTPTVLGLAVVDDYLDAKIPRSVSAAVWSRYDVLIESLAAQGAQIIVLPEKIEVLPPAASTALQTHLAALAAKLNIWIVAGVGVDDGGKRVNLAWMLSPQAGLVENYQKHRMAPPEREFIPGHEYNTHVIAGVQYGLAICKDFHFASMGRAYGQRGAAVMLVPAWDFIDDAELASAITLTRGVENGYTIVRASREGWLTVTDGYGRMLAREDSAPLPGKAMLYRATLPAQIGTLYTRIGDVFGWICVGLVVLLFAIGLRSWPAHSSLRPFNKGDAVIWSG